MKNALLGGVAALLLVGATLALSQTTVPTSARFAGLVHSTQGGFKFPDDTIQTTAVMVAPSRAEYQFVGVTPPVASGGIGALAMTQACQAEFGTGVRMCRSPEILGTVDVPPASAWKSSLGWVQPTIVSSSGSLAFDSRDSPYWREFLWDSSGIYSSGRNLSCSGWSQSSSGQGLSVLEDGGAKLGAFTLTNCTSSSAGVACCAPG